MRNRSFALGRLKSGEMNRTEKAYSEVLEELKHTGKVLWWRFEGIKLKLAGNTSYTPDFFVLNASNELEAHEVKGYFMDDAKVKVKVAAEMYPFRFFIVRTRAKKDGGGWQIEEV